MVSSDPTDKSFQVSDKYAPDKFSTWTIPIERDAWVLSHNGTREEIRSMTEAIQAMKDRGGNIQDWEVACIRKVWHSHARSINSHRTHEDVFFFPMLKKRFHFPEKYVADRDEVVDKIDEISDLAWTFSKKDTSSLEHILEALIDYESMMLGYLKREEDECLPLVRAYFTPKEVEPKMQKVLAFATKIEKGSLMNSMGTDSFRNEYMKENDIPCYIWYIRFRGCRLKFVKEFVKPLEALKTGNQEIICQTFRKSSSRSLRNLFLTDYVERTINKSRNTVADESLIR